VLEKGLRITVLDIALIKYVDESRTGVPILGTCTPRGTFAFLKGYI